MHCFQLRKNEIALSAPNSHKFQNLNLRLFPAQWCQFEAISQPQTWCECIGKLDLNSTFGETGGWLQAKRYEFYFP